MPLAKSLIPILFQGGLDQKTPAKLAVPGSFLALENVVRRKTGQLEKRYGFEARSAETTDGDTLTLGSGLAARQDEVLLRSGDDLYSGAASQWVDRGTLPRVTLESYPLSRPQTVSIIFHDIAVGETKALATSTGGGLYHIDLETYASAVIDPGFTFSAGRLLYIDGVFYAYYINGTSLALCVRTLDETAAPDAWSAETVVRASSDLPIDVIEYNGVPAVACKDRTTHKWVATMCSTSGAATATTYTSSATQLAQYNLALAADTTNGRIWVQWSGVSGATQSANVGVLNAAMTAFGAVTLRSGATSYTREMTGAVDDTGTFYSYDTEISAVTSGAARNGGTVNRGAYTWTGVNGVAPAVATAWGPAYYYSSLICKAFNKDGKVYVGLGYRATPSSSPTNADYLGYQFIVDQNSKVVSSHSPLGSWGVKSWSSTSKYSMLPSVCVANGKHYTLHEVISLLTDSGTSYFDFKLGSDLVVYDFDTIYGQPVQAGPVAMFPGAITSVYDGTQVVEAGFLTPPVVVQTGLGAGAPFSAGNVVTYLFTYAWTDAQGQVWESAPSAVQTYTSFAGEPPQVTISSCAVTNKTRADIRINVYVCASSSTTAGPWYLSLAPANPTLNGSYTVDLAGYPGSGGRFVYTTGGILDNLAFPASHTAVFHRGRMFATDARTGYVNHSKRYVYGEPINYNDVLVVPVEADGGRATGLASLDDKLIIFKRRRIYVNFGDGPLDTGIQSDYLDPVCISRDVGCIDARSIVNVPSGVMFKSEKGFYLLDRGLRLSFVGGAVEDYNDETVTSAVLVGDESEVRFTTTAGPCLVYNYLFGTWSTFTNYEAVGAVAIGNDYYHVKTDGTVNAETAGEYSDNGDDIAMAIETGWLQLAGIQSYQRVYKILLLGDLVSDHTTRVKIAYDFETTYNETIDFPTATNLTTSNFQIDVRPARQKCEAIKLRIEDVNADEGASLKLVAMTAEVGRKSGANKLPASQKAGNG